MSHRGGGGGPPPPPHLVPRPVATPTDLAPARGAELELTVDSPRPRRQRRRPPRRLRRLRRRRAARRPRPRGGRQVQARLRRGARGRDPRAVARPDRAGRRPPRRAVAGAPLRAPARGQGRAGRRRAAPDRQARRLRAGPIVPAVEQWRYRNKLEYSFGTGPDGTLVCGFHAPAGSTRSSRSTTACSPPSAATPRASRCSPGRASTGLRPGTGATSAACCATSSSARAGGPASCRCGSSPRRARSTPTLAAAVDCEGLFWTQAAGLGRAPRAATTKRRPEAAARAARRPRVPDLAGGVLPDQHRDGRGALRRRGRARRPARARARLRPLLRHRHDRASRSHSRARGDRRRDRRAAVADAIDNARRNEIANAPFFAGDIRLAMRELVEQAGRPDVCVIDPPRAGLSQKVVRRIIEAAPERIVYVSCNPTTLAPNAAQLVEAGYALRRVRPVDMFPQTPHIECVALLERAWRTRRATDAQAACAQLVARANSGERARRSRGRPRVDAHAAVRGRGPRRRRRPRVQAGAPVDDPVRARVERHVADLGRERARERRAEARAALAAQAAPRDQPGHAAGAERRHDADLREHERVDRELRDDRRAERDDARHEVRAGARQRLRRCRRGSGR